MDTDTPTKHCGHNENFHRHPNGGGWVAKSAHVSNSAFVGPDARVCGTATILERAHITDFSVLSRNALVGGSAVVEGNASITGTVLQNARIGGRAAVFDGALVFGEALVAGDAVLADEAKVGGNARVQTGCVYGGTWLTDPESLTVGEITLSHCRRGIISTGHLAGDQRSVEQWADGQRWERLHGLPEDQRGVVRVFIEQLHRSLSDEEKSNARDYMRQREEFLAATRG